MRVALIGVGVMGSAIARRLLDTDVALTVFDYAACVSGSRAIAIASSTFVM
jgi:3-hydroxyisobutyrate dehydrogenase-like beta-hydroxyacid dehydrogenase